MNSAELSRRDFHQLTMAAFGGALSGALVGCGGGEDAPTPQPSLKPVGEQPPETPRDSPNETAVNDAYLLDEPHVCRNLNTCAGKGKSGSNACAGQDATCATAEAHGCHTQNQCKGQGGCGSTAGRNECAGKGECGVPLSDAKWPEVRAAWETAMKAASKEFEPLGQGGPSGKPKQESSQPDSQS